MDMLELFSNSTADMKLVALSYLFFALITYILYALLLREKNKTQALSRRIALLTKELVKDGEQSPCGDKNSKHMEKPHEGVIIWQKLFGYVTNSFKKLLVYVYPKGKRDNKEQEELPPHNEVLYHDDKP